MPGGLVERLEVPGEEPGRLRRVRDRQRPDVVQSGGKRPVDVVVVRAGARQQKGRDSTEINGHVVIVHPRRRKYGVAGLGAWRSGTKGSTVAFAV